MARMYPQQVSQETRSEAERTLFEALATSLPDDYTVVHGVRWLVRDRHSGARDGEADFVIVHPERGILVLEAKGGYIRCDRAAGRWYSNGIEIRDPFAQVEGNKHSLLDKLKATPAFGGRYVTIGHAVAFPDGVIARDLRLDAPREIILDAADLATLKGWVERALAFYAPDRRPRGLGADGVRTLVDILCPAVEIRRLLGAAIVVEGQAIAHLTEEQYAVLDLLRHQPRAAISGCAGSGKTLLAMEQARRLALQGFRVLVTCFNIALGEHLRAHVDRRSSETSSSPTRHRAQGTVGCSPWHVATFHQLCLEMARAAGLDVPAEPPPGVAEKEYYERLLPQALLEAATGLPPQFDAIVVDEGQDFRPDWWLPLQALLTDADRGVFYVFYDDNQNLYGTGPAPAADLPRYPLTRNCRNTQQIHRTFLPFYRSDTLPQAIGPDGRPPQILFYERPEDLRHLLGQVLAQLVHGERVPPKDIVILTPRSPARSALAAWPAIGRLRLTSQPPAHADEIQYTSIYRFKGLESPVVILAEFRPSPEQDAATLLYVGCSRARSHLVILADESQRAHLAPPCEGSTPTLANSHLSQQQGPRPGASI